MKEKYKNVLAGLDVVKTPARVDRSKGKIVGLPIFGTTKSNMKDEKIKPRNPNPPSAVGGGSLDPFKMTKSCPIDGRQRFSDSIHKVNKV